MPRDDAPSRRAESPQLLALVGTAIAQMFVPFIALVFLKTNVAPGAAVPVIGLNEMPPTRLE
jgi:hypothetical protein